LIDNKYPKCIVKIAPLNCINKPLLMATANGQPSKWKPPRMRVEMVRLYFEKLKGNFFSGKKCRWLSISNLDTNNEKWRENADVCSFKKCEFLRVSKSACVKVRECVFKCVRESERGQSLLRTKDKNYDAKF